MTDFQLIDITANNQRLYLSELDGFRFLAFLPKSSVGALQ